MAPRPPSWRDVPALNPARGARLNGQGLGLWRSPAPWRRVATSSGGGRTGDGRGQPNDLERQIAEQALNKDDGFSLTDLGGDALLGALDALDTPGAIVRSGVKELRDAAGLTPGDTASFGDFYQQARDNISGSQVLYGTEEDPSALFKLPVLGEVGSGFALTVATDPLTYVTGGAARVGAEPGAAAARKLLSKGVTESLGEQAVRQAERGGRTFANAAERGAAVRSQGTVIAQREAQQALKYKSNQMLSPMAREAIGSTPGTYLRIPGAKRLKIDKVVERLAGPARVVDARGGGRALRVTSRELGAGRAAAQARARVAQGPTSAAGARGFGNTVAKLFTKRPDIRQKILFGTPEEAAVGFLGTGARTAGDLQRRLREATWGSEMANITKRAEKAGIDGEDLFFATAERADSVAALGEASQRVLAQAAKAGDDDLLTDAQAFFDRTRAEFNQIDPELPVIMEVEGYVPRRASEWAKAQGLSGFGDAGGALRKETFDFRRMYGPKTVDRPDAIDKFMGQELVDPAADAAHRTVERQLKDIADENDLPLYFSTNAFEAFPEHVRAMARRYGDEFMAKQLRDLGIAEPSYIRQLTERGVRQGNIKARIFRLLTEARARADNAALGARRAQRTADQGVEGVQRGRGFVKTAREGREGLERERSDLQGMADALDPDGVREYETYLRGAADEIQVERDGLLAQVASARDTQFGLDHAVVEAGHRLARATYKAYSRVTRLQSRLSGLETELGNNLERMRLMQGGTDYVAARNAVDDIIAKTTERANKIIGNEGRYAPGAFDAAAARLEYLENLKRDPAALRAWADKQKNLGRYKSSLTISEDARKLMAETEQDIIANQAEMFEIEKVLHQFEDLAQRPTDQLEQQLQRINSELEPAVASWDEGVRVGAITPRPQSTIDFQMQDNFGFDRVSTHRYNTSEIHDDVQAFVDGPAEGYVRVYRGQLNGPDGKPVVNLRSETYDSHRKDTVGLWYSEHPTLAMSYARQRYSDAIVNIPSANGELPDLGIGAQQDLMFVDLPEAVARSRRVSNARGDLVNQAGWATPDEIVVTPQVVRKHNLRTRRVPADFAMKLRMTDESQSALIAHRQSTNALDGLGQQAADRYKPLPRFEIMDPSDVDALPRLAQDIPASDGGSLRNEIETLGNARASVMHELEAISEAKRRVAGADEQGPNLLASLDSLEDTLATGDSIIHAQFPDLPAEVNGARIREFFNERNPELQTQIDDTKGMVMSAYADADTMSVELDQIRQARRESRAKLNRVSKEVTAKDRELWTKQSELLTQADEAMTRSIEIGDELDDAREALGELRFQIQSSQYAESMAEHYLGVMHSRQLRYEADVMAAEATAAGAKRTEDTWTRVARKAFSTEQETALQSALKDGYKQIGAVSMTEHGWLVDAMRGATIMAGPEGIRPLLRMYDKALTLWKGYALSTPGTIMRNLFGGVFNNGLADIGVDISDYRAITGWMRNQGANLKPAERELLQQISDAGILTGSATVLEIERRLGRTNLNPLSVQNKAIQLGRRGQEDAEELVRGALALRTLRNGGTMDDAIENVMKYHFDYDDISAFERSVLRRVVPFYTWTRKNFPLMLEQIVQRPTKFTRFYQLKNEIEEASPEETIIPSYFTENLGIRLPFSLQGSQAYMLPDLPFTALNDVTDPTTALSQVSPFIKTPIEYAFGRQFFKGIPLRDEYKPVPGALQVIPGVMPALGAIGKAERGGDGQWMMKDKDMYVLEQLVPVFGRGRRLFPSEEKFDQRVLSSWLSFGFGLGIRTNSPQERRNAAYARVDAELERYQTYDELGYFDEGTKQPRPGQTIRAAYEQLGVAQ